MELAKFISLINKLNTAYRGRFILTEEEEIKIYFNALNDLGLEKLERAVALCIQNEEFYPSVATIRKYAKKNLIDWSMQWGGYVTGIQPYGLNKASQYAITVLGRNYIDTMIDQGKAGYAMKEFRDLYNKYFSENKEQVLRLQKIEHNFLYSVPNTCSYLEDRFAKLDAKTKKELIENGVIREKIEEFGYLRQELFIVCATPEQIKILKEKGIYGTNNRVELLIEEEDRFSELDDAFRKQLEDAGAIVGQNLICSNATQEQIDTLIEKGLL